MVNNKTFSLVLPAYNEEVHIKKNIESFFETNIFDEIIVVDNNSSDNTKEEIKKTKAVYVSETTQGYGAALRRGMELSTGNFIVTCEPDSTFSAKDIHKFLSYIDDFECIFGTRTTKSLIQKGAKMNFYLRIGNIAVAKFLEYIFLGPTLSDVGCTYKVISRNSYEKIKDELTVVGSEFQPELMIKLILKKVRILEIPVNYLEIEGRSKITYNFISSFKLALKMIFLILILRIKSIFQDTQ
jgi:glycosyltransferase involved in cell wall biosynthesis